MSKSMRRSTTIAGGIISVLILSACGSPETSTVSSSPGGSVEGAGKTINVLMGTNSQYAEEQQDWFNSIGEIFTEETGATIQWETFATANDELTRIQTSVVAGDGPDVYSLGTTFTPTAYSTGAFVQFGEAEWEKVGGKDRFVPAALGISGPSDEDQIAVPFVSRPFVMAYNKDLLAEAGIEEPATSWDELREQAIQMTHGDVYGLAIAYKDNYDPWKFIWGMKEQAGSPIVDGGTVSLDDDATQTAFESYFGWLTEDKIVDPASIGWANTNAVAAFAEGKAAYLPMTTATSIPTLSTSFVKDSYAFALMPTIPPGESSMPEGGQDAASILSGDNLVVANYSENQDLALAFIELVTREDVQLGFYDTFGQFPTNQTAAESLTSDPVLAVSVESAERSVATPFTGAWSEIQLAITNIAVQTIPELQSGSLGAETIAERLAEAQQTAKAALDRTPK